MRAFMLAHRLGAAGLRPGPALPEAVEAGTAERARHDIVAVERMARAEGGARRARVLTQRPIDRYLHRGEIDRRSHDAGDRLRADFERAGRGPRVTTRYAAKIEGKTKGARPRWDGPDDGALAAGSRWRAALDGLGPSLAAIVFGVVCAERSAADCAASQGRPRNDGIALLRAGLAELADRYDPPSRPRSAAWRAEDASVMPVNDG